MGVQNFRNTLGLRHRDMSILNAVRHHNGRKYIYSGPIVPSCDHGCWHRLFKGEEGGEYGSISDGSKEMTVESNGRHTIVGATISQIQNSDLLFAWFESLDAYGTIAEIGIAVGSDIPVYIGFREDVFPLSPLLSHDSYC